MRAISLWQPWASAMALGLKKIETRHWSTNYRGPLLIHAAKRWTRDERDFWDIYRDGKPHLPPLLPLGAIVAVGTLVDVVRTEQLLAVTSPKYLADREFHWGNYDEGRYGWIFEEIRALPTPLAYKGAQGFFHVDSEFVQTFMAPYP